MVVLLVSYHALAEPMTAISLPPDRLERHLSALTDAGFDFVSLDDCAEWTAGRRELPPRAAAVTFDDGYASVVDTGLRVLERWRVPATVFVIAGRLGNDNRWPGQFPWVPAMPLLDEDGIRALAAANVAIGSHSLSHARLTALPPDALRAEVMESGDRLEQLLQAPVRHFAYPAGERGPREIAIVRQRYASAVSAVSRIVTRGTDPHDLPRLDAHDVDVAARLRLLDGGLLVPYLALRRPARRLRRALERISGSG